MLMLCGCCGASVQVQSGLGPQAVLGVIPEALTPREISSELIGDTKIVNDMHERKVGNSLFAELPAASQPSGCPSQRGCLCMPDNPLFFVRCASCSDVQLRPCRSAKPPAPCCMLQSRRGQRTSTAACDFTKHTHTHQAAGTSPVPSLHAYALHGTNTIHHISLHHWFPSVAVYHYTQSAA